MTMPNVEAQSRLIDGTFDATGISADSIDYVEAHAPGTKLGDPIEVRALSEALKRRGASRSDVPIGSVKSNIGHAESAAGVASVIKTLEQMRHHRLAPSIHAADVNPNITFEDSPLELQVHLEPWKPRVGPGGLAEPYRAMINCFGAGGANAHALIESVHEEDSVPAGARSGGALSFLCRVGGNAPTASRSVRASPGELLLTSFGRARPGGAGSGDPGHRGRGGSSASTHSR